MASSNHQNKVAIAYFQILPTVSVELDHLSTLAKAIRAISLVASALIVIALIAIVGFGVYLSETSATTTVTSLGSSETTAVRSTSSSSSTMPTTSFCAHVAGNSKLNFWPTARSTCCPFQRIKRRDVDRRRRIQYAGYEQQCNSCQ